MPVYFESQALIEKHDHSETIIRFLRIVLEYNKKINLVSRETSFAGLKKIASDCLVPFELLSAPSGVLFDIGPGAGFPSVIVMLAFPGITGVLFERTGKKAEFLKSVTREFNLDAEIVSEDFLSSKKSLISGSFDLGLMKYVRPERKIIDRALSLLKPSGIFIYYSGAGGTKARFPSSISSTTVDYYLDDPKEVRCFRTFSHG